MTGAPNLGFQVIDELDDWVNRLAAPILPPREFHDGGELVRLEFLEHMPHTVMVGKCIRAASGIHAAQALAELGYITECAAVLRMVSDFCMEINAIGEALNRGGDLPSSVRAFVDLYFVPKMRTPDEFEAAEKPRYVSREELMKAEVRLIESAKLDGQKVRAVHRFLNMTYDSYVHGSYESTMELYDPNTGRFRTRSHPSTLKRQEFSEAVLLKLHEVVVAIELTAAVTAEAAVFNAAREAR